MVGHLPSTCENLGFIPSTTKKYKDRVECNDLCFWQSKILLLPLCYILLLAFVPLKIIIVTKISVHLRIVLIIVIEAWFQKKSIIPRDLAICSISS